MCLFPSSFCSLFICFITSLHVEKFLICETLMKFICPWFMNYCFYCIAFVMVIICPTANRVVSFPYMVGSCVDRWVVRNVGRCSFLACLMRMSVNRCWDCSVDRRRIPFLRGMLEKSIFLIKNSFVLYISLLHIIFIILLRMHGVSGVCCHSGVVVVILPIFWTTVDRFFFGCVDQFLVGTVDRCGCLSFDRRRVLCLVLSSTVAWCDESWIINSSGGRTWLLDWNRIVVDMRIYESQAQLVGLHVAYCSYCWQESTPK